MTFTSSEDALAKGMDRELKARREDACVNFVKRISPDNPIFSSIQSRIVHLSSAYSLLAQIDDLLTCHLMLIVLLIL